jgi:predicted molibdopterin-dependent oxidoreductase YjgC
VTGYKVKEAVKKRDAKLITIESLVPAVGTISNIANLSVHHFPTPANRFAHTVLGLIKAVVEENLVDAAVANASPKYVEAIRKAVGALSWTALQSATGTTRAALTEAGRAFAGAPRAVILVGQGVLRAPGGQGIVTNLLDLLLLTGQHSRPGCGLGPLAEQNNDQGALELGAAAEFLPGPADLDHAQARQTIAGLWKEELPQGPGRSLMEILDDAREGKTKALFVVGENPAGSLPPSAQVADALGRLDLLVCQELFLTETAALAHVVLPACSYAEKEGSFTNTEGHVQPLHPAIDPVGDSRPDWEILSALSVLIGYPIEYGDGKEILKEIRSVIPGYGRFGPAPSPPRPDPAVVVRYLQAGHADDLAVRYAWPPVNHDQEKKLLLTVGQTLFHSGKFSTRAKGLLKIQAAGYLALNPADAAERRIAEGSQVKIINQHGEVRTTAKLLDRIPPGTVFFPEHFDQDVRGLLSVEVDPQTRVPSWRQAWVNVERAEE